MPIPDRPLKLEFDPDDLTLDEWEIFETFKISHFKAFMAKYSNWTAAEVGRLTRRELQAVAVQIAEQVKELAVPKAS